MLMHIMNMNVVIATKIYRRSHRLTNAEAMFSVISPYLFFWRRVIGFSDSTYPEMTKNIATAKWPPASKTRTPGSCTK